ncbi:MAG: M23 family metallopeptidase [Muribaculaceae bacterium]|nr:M23 family metallopeptidase [Muribaculaceae bacterium]
MGNDKRSGNFITLRHGNYTISYCHLSHILVPKGRPVKAGSPIAITGSSGRSTAPYLHLSTKYKRKPIDTKVLLDYIIQSK